MVILVYCKNNIKKQITIRDKIMKSQIPIAGNRGNSQKKILISSN